MSNQFYDLEPSNKNGTFSRKLEQIGQILDEKLADPPNLVLRQEAGMDVIFSIIDLIVDEKVIKSFIPTIGVDCNPTKQKIERLKTHRAWNNDYEKRKYRYIQGVHKK